MKIRSIYYRLSLLVGQILKPLNRLQHWLFSKYLDEVERRMDK